MDKSDRLQLRIKPELKKWFKDFAEKRGGMSKTVQDQIIKWKNGTEETDGRSEERTRD